MGTPHIMLNKTGSSCEPKAFIQLFEATVVAWGWATLQWAGHLFLIPSREEQFVAKQLPATNLLEYPDRKWAIPQQVGLTSEQHCQRFRSLMLAERGRMFVFTHQLQDGCHHWLRNTTPRTSSIRLLEGRRSGSSSTTQHHWIRGSNWQRTI